MSVPGIVVEEVSPLGNVMAYVEDDGRSVYLYLMFQQETEENADEPSPDSIRACWVRNRGPAPAEIDEDAMDQGMAPMLPRDYCRHPLGMDALKPDELRIVWFEEGNGVALIESGEILTIIPPWSGQNGFYGYARDCTGESPVAWPLHDDNVLRERIRRAAEYWSLWDQEKFWERYSSRLMKPLEEVLGSHVKYYAIDGNKWPPKALLRFDQHDRYILITVGVSLLPQPNVDSVADDPSPLCRIELAAAIDKKCPLDEVKRLGSYMSGQAAYPWATWTWLGDGHTLDCNATPESCGGKQFPAALLTTRLGGVPKIVMPYFRGDPINLLWIVPITEAELNFAMENGTEKLTDALNKANVDVTIRLRRGIDPE